MEPANSASSITTPDGLSLAQPAQTLTATSWQPATKPPAAAEPVGLAPTIAATVASRTVSGAVDQPHNKAVEQAGSGGVVSGKQLRRIRLFAITGGTLAFLASFGVGFLVRWLAGGGQILSFDEFAILLITVASRDSIFRNVPGYRTLRTAGCSDDVARPQRVAVFSYSLPGATGPIALRPSRSCAPLLLIPMRPRNGRRRRRFSDLRKSSLVHKFASGSDLKRFSPSDALTIYYSSYLRPDF